MKTGLWIIDVQEKLLPKISSPVRLLHTISQLIGVAPCLGWSILVTEQYPQGLGGTVDALVKQLPPHTPIWEKTTFSGYGDLEIQHLADQLADTWILVGVEAHICVLQTAIDLQQRGKGVWICYDGIASRSRYQCRIALEQFRFWNIPVTTAETLIYQEIRDSTDPRFRTLLPWITGQYALALPSEEGA